MEKELREDFMETKVLQEAIENYSKRHGMSIERVEDMIKNQPAARKLVIDMYWADKLL